MVDDRNELRHVNWNELFNFTYVFKSFKLAIHPSKMFLALAAIILVWAMGHFQERIWGRSQTHGWVQPAQIQPAQLDEINVYAISPDACQASRDAWLNNRPTEAAMLLSRVRQERASFGDFLSRLPAASLDGAFRTALNAELPRRNAPSEASETTRESAAQDLRGTFKDISNKIEGLQKDLLSAADKARSSALKSPGNDTPARIKSDYIAVRKAITDVVASYQDQLRMVRGARIFDAFTSYQWQCLDGAIQAVFAGNLTRGVPNYAVATDRGFVAWMLMSLEGFEWLVVNHWLFAIVFFLIVLAIWALFGGAIYRIAALHAAHDEKISIAQALRFAMSKWFSFFMAPLIPLGAILVAGLVIALGGLIGNLWGFGAAIMGLLSFVGVVLGLMIAFITIGLVGGFGLMYPTIAVESSDSFDAISRSFAYVFARPWRALMYGLAALIYGVICYLFVRFFAFVALKATYVFLKWGAFTGGQAVGGDSKVQVMWTEPTFFGSLYGNFNWAAMGPGEAFGAVFLWIWTALLAAMVGAFLLTYCASSTSIIYLLLRRKVDATDLDDVYVHETAPEPAEPAAGEAPVTATPAAPAAPSIENPRQPPKDDTPPGAGTSA